jgi:hypothetical protein
VDGFEEEPFQAPDGIELRAYRFWLVDVGGTIYSFGGETRWVGHEWVRARCARPDRKEDPQHRAPVERCSCGIYALKSLELAERFFEDWMRPIVQAPTNGPTSPWSTLKARAASSRWGPRYATPIGGILELAGRVIEHDRGYRAERARIVEVLPAPLEASQECAARVARQLGVEVGEGIESYWTPTGKDVLDERAGP